MPSFDLYKRMNGFSTNGIARKVISDEIDEATWDEDINTRIVYLYDYYHDSEPLMLRGLHPEIDRLKVPVSVKFIQHTKQTYDKDVVTYHIRFKPSQKMCVDYYTECFESRYDAIWPIGLYVDIPDEKNNYNRWLIVDKADMYATQFPTFEVLPCDKILQFIIDGKKAQIAAVLRSQNS